MTKADLIALLDSYPDDTPIFNGGGFDLHASSVQPMNYDIWGVNEPDADGNEQPGIGTGIAIGPRF